MNQCDQTKDFYAVRVNSGQEKTFLNSYAKMLKQTEFRNYFGEAYVCWVVRENQNKTNKKTSTKLKNKWPGYVIIEMHLNDKTMRELRTIKSMRGVLGKHQGSTPHPISIQEVESLLAHLDTELST